MGDKYTGTTLIQTASPEDVNKAALDLLKKVNEVSQDAASQNSSLSNRLDLINAYIVASGGSDAESSGKYEKYSNGTLKQWGWVWIWESGMANYSFKTLTWPTAFLVGTSPDVVLGAGGVKAYASGVPTSPGDTPGGHGLNTVGFDFSSVTPAQQVKLRIIRGAISALTDVYYYVVSWEAIGRWK